MYEKEVISKQAIAGIYYFQRAGDFIYAGEKVLSGASVDNKFYFIYIQPANTADKKATYIELKENQVHSFYSPEAIEQFVKGAKLEAKMKRLTVNIVIPAAARITICKRRLAKT